MGILRPGMPDRVGRPEQITREVDSQTIIMRSSFVFGAEDAFFNRFAAMVRGFPVLPLMGGGHNRIQPVFVGDVAAAFGQGG